MGKKYCFNLKVKFHIKTHAASRKILEVKDTHGEKTPSNKTPALTESTDMDIWVVGTSNQLFIRGF